MHGLEPLVQRDMAGLENCTDANRELLTAVAALLKAGALDAPWIFLARFGADALQLIDAIFAVAVRADRTVRPN